MAMLAISAQDVGEMLRMRRKRRALSGLTKNLRLLLRHRSVHICSESCPEDQYFDME